MALFACGSRAFLAVTGALCRGYFLPTSAVNIAEIEEEIRRFRPQVAPPAARGLRGPARRTCDGLVLSRLTHPTRG